MLIIQQLVCLLFGADRVVHSWVLELVITNTFCVVISSSIVSSKMVKQSETYIVCIGIYLTSAEPIPALEY